MGKPQVRYVPMADMAQDCDGHFLASILSRGYGASVAGGVGGAVRRCRRAWSPRALPGGIGYGTTDLGDLAAAYAFGLARNHAFVDGNKRIAFLAMVTFLGLNDIEFVVPEAEAVVMMVAVAAGEVSEESLARWIRDNLPAAQGGKTR